MTILPTIALILATAAGTSMAAQPQALVYRGPAACPGCPESVAHVLRKSASNFNVTFVGPNEDVDITSATLGQADVYAQPGGGSYAPAWKAMKPYKQLIRDFVNNGGKYLGFCEGAYLAGYYPLDEKHVSGFGLLPEGDDVGEEITRPGSQVKNGKDNITNVNWQFSTGPNAGKTEDKRWVYFQDGPYIKATPSPNLRVLGRYSSNNDIAGTLSSFGEGFVGLVGPHPEATKDWYTHGFTNPDGINLDIAYDLIETTYQGLLNVSGSC